jgi:hypothetical protein
MGCVKAISGCWRASILVLLWIRFANIDKQENNNGRQQSPQYFHGLSFAQRCLRVLIPLLAVSTEIRAMFVSMGISSMWGRLGSKIPMRSGLALRLDKTDEARRVL